MMIFFRLAVVLFLFSCGARNKIFTVIQAERLQFDSSVEKKYNQPFFKIMFTKPSIPAVTLYPLSMPPGIDSMAAIEQLLEFQGDTRLCAFPSMNYNMLSSSIVVDTFQFYSLQVEALFIINQIYFDKPFIFSERPLLVDKKSNKKEAIDGELIKTAFREYRTWYEKVKVVGIKQAKSDGILPLSGSTIEWGR